MNQEIETYCIHQTPMPWQVNEVQSAFDIQVKLSSCGNSLDIFNGLENFWDESYYWMINELSWFSCCFCIVWKHLWAMIPIQSWNCERWQNSGLSEIWKCGRSADKRRTVRRSWDLSPEALQKDVSAEKYTADGPPRDRGRSAGHRYNRLASDTPVVCPRVIGATG